MIVHIVFLIRITYSAVVTACYTAWIRLSFPLFVYVNCNTDQRLNDIVGSAYYVAPEVLHRSYSLEADIWSVGVIAYILLCGSRPFWARTESGIFRTVLRADPSFDELPWPSISREAKDFVKRLLNKDYRKRMTAVQALSNSLSFSSLYLLALIKCLALVSVCVIFCVGLCMVFAVHF